MKKRILLILILLVLFIITNLSITTSQPDPTDAIPDVPGLGEVNPETGMPKNIEKVTKTVGNISDEIEKRKFITNEWDKMLAKYQAENRLVKLIFFFNNLFKALSPIFKLFTGVGYSLSWFFFVVLSIWLLVVVMIYNTIKTALEIEEIYSFLIAIIIPTLASHVKISGFGTFEYCAYLLGPLISNAVFLILFFMFIILIGYFYERFMKEAQKEAEKEEREEREMGMKIYWKALKNTFKYGD